jgi:hypothetical protein
MKHFAQLQGVCQASTILKGCVQQSLKNETSNECPVPQATFSVIKWVYQKQKIK